MSLPKTFEQFEATLVLKKPAKDWPLELQSLWWDAKGNWEASHEIAQELSNEMGNWIHAYLHRKERDQFNAGYWYRQANKPFSTIPLNEELMEMVMLILTKRH